MAAAVPADQIALINANAAPLPANDRNGAAIVYGQVQYNGANIQAADVPPPAWLNIAPKIVNRLAKEREARAAVAAGQQVSPILVNPIVSVMAPVSVVDPALAMTEAARVAAVPAVATAASVAAAVPAAPVLLPLVPTPAAVAAAVAATNAMAAIIPAAAGVVVPIATVAGVVAAAVGAMAGIGGATAANVVTMAEAAASVLNPQLPAVAPAPGLPPAPGTLQALLRDGEWGNALIGLVQDVRTPIPITIDSIDSIFEWSATSVLANPACIGGYVQAIADLLRLPSGIRLFRDIIIAHHCCPYLPKMRFRRTQDESKFSLFCNNENLCSINLKWDNTTLTYVGGEYVCIATNNHLPAPAGGYPGKGGQIDFVDVHIPPSLVLAHELNHYLRTLIACKSSMDQEVDIVSQGILDPLSPGANIGQCKAMKSVTCEVRDIYHGIEHKNILRKILPSPPATPEERMFNDLWSEGNLHEMANILPTANILGRGGSYGSSSYSDGIIFGEAYRDTQIGPQLAFSRGEAVINLTAIPLSEEGFVRLGHWRPISFWSELRKLSANALAEFKDLVQKLLDTITVNGQTLWAGNNNLPSF
jgi:hypothetical protein